jgi:signal transduction histidine kinase
MPRTLPNGALPLVLPTLASQRTQQEPSAKLQQLALATHEVLAHLSEADLIHRLLTHACALLDAQRGSLYAVDSAGNVLLAAHVPPTSVTTGALNSLLLAQRTADDHLPLVVDCRQDTAARSDFCAGGECPLTLSLPLHWQGRTIGVLHLARDPAEQQHVLADDLWLLSHYADLAAVALVHHVRLMEMTTDASTPRRSPVEDSLRSALHESQQLYESLAATLVATEGERGRIARELHDGLRQHLVGIQLQCDTIQVLLARGAYAAVPPLIATVQHALQLADAEMSRIVRDLHPPIVTEAGLCAALCDLGVRWGTKCGVAVAFDLPPSLPALPEATATALYRIAQEALTNTARHAAAQQVQIQLRVEGQQLLLQLQDDGRGGALLRSGGVGMRSMRERAQALHGTLTVVSPPGAGTQISVCVPMEA